MATLRNSKGVTLQKKYNVVQHKHYIQGSDDQSSSTTNEVEEESSKENNFWEHAPDEIVEMILLYTLQQAGNSFPGHKCEIYNNIKSTCRRWAQIIKGKGPALLPKIYADTSKPFGNPFHS